jgi:pimeloyl-ACP methyl ester carboxylesterase
MATQLINPLEIEKHTWNWQGHTVKYAVQGDGPPLLLIHGFGASIGHWRKNIPVLAEAGYRVYALDLLGFGDSEKAEIDYSIDVWKRLILDFWEAFIQTPTVFAGNSIGGLITLTILADRPEASKGGILLNCAGGLNHRPEELTLPLRWVMGTFTQLVSSEWIGPFVFNRVRQKSRIRGSLKQVYGNTEAITDELVDMIYQPTTDPKAQKVFASILTAPAGPRPEELLPQIQAPLLVLWGEDDPWTPIKGAEIYQRAAASEAAVAFHSIPQTGHCPHDERPETVNSLILDWLDTLADDSSH